MSNKPVAWMSNGKEFYVQKNYCPDFIPLYTHPVSKAKDRFPSYESICLQCGTTIYKPAFNTLTDEEIKDVYFNTFNWNFSESASSPFLDFARAILRKAQEK